MEIFKSFFSDSQSVDIKKFMTRCKEALFIIITSSSIMLSTLACGVPIHYTVALILISNQVYNRSDGWHSKGKKSCFILSTIVFTTFAYLSSIIVVSPIVLLIAISLLCYKDIEQHMILLATFILAVSNAQYSWLLSACLFSTILSYLVSGKNIVVTNLLNRLDKALCKIVK